MMDSLQQTEINLGMEQARRAPFALYSDDVKFRLEESVIIKEARVQGKVTAITLRKHNVIYGVRFWMDGMRREEPFGDDELISADEYERRMLGYGSSGG